MSPFHLNEYTLPEVGGMISSVFPDPGEYYGQSRVDGLDWLPQLLRLKLGDSGRRTPGERASAATPPLARRAHALLRRFPSPAALWKIRPFPPPLRAGLRYSHILWAARPSS
ncbi:MAG: hypothetical protein L3K01_02325 [Thermoplasmata archaeon]|nr:hypothetical protein [Thermoplasmata archaeon]